MKSPLSTHCCTYITEKTVSWIAGTHYIGDDRARVETNANVDIPHVRIICVNESLVGGSDRGHGKLGWEGWDREKSVSA